MSPVELETLLARIEDGSASEADVRRAGELLAELEAAEPLPLGGAVRAEAGRMEVDREVAAEVGVPVLPVAEAVRAEAGAVDVAGEVLAGIGGSLPIAEAVRAELGGEVPIEDAVAGEAGRIDIAGDVMAMLGLSRPARDEVPVASAVRDEAGGVDVAASVADPLDPPIPVAEAVRMFAGTTDVVGGVLRRLELAEDAVPLADAVRAEAGGVDVVDAVLASVDLADERLPIAEAVREGAGAVDVAEVVMQAIAPEWVSAMLDHELDEAAHRLVARRLATDREAAIDMTAFAEIGRLVRSGVAEEIGEAPVLWGDVARAIGLSDPDEVPGWDGSLLVEAVCEEAGSVDVTRDVMARVRRVSSLPTTFEEAPAPANTNGFTIGAVALAAVALFAVLLGRAYNPVGEEVVVTPPPAPEVHAAALQFAAPDEIVVQDLSYGQDTMVQVFQAEDEGALIIWVDEETL